MGATSTAELEAALTPRRGLGAAGDKLAVGPCAIAYMGASVTVQRAGFRPLLHDAIRRRYAREHRAVAAAVGGVSAVGTAFWVDKLALPQSPDISIFDCSTSDMDSGVALDLVEAAADGTVAKLAAAGCAPVLIHLYRAEWTERCAAVVAAWERVAERHGVPSIDVGAPLRERLRPGSPEQVELFYDGIHTTSPGAEVVAGMLDRALARLASLDPDPEALAAPPGPPPEPDFSRARLVDVAAEDAAGAGAMRLFRFQLPFLQLGVGEPLTVSPDGELLGLALIVGPDSGAIGVEGAGGPERLMLFDKWCHYERLSACLFRRPRPAGEPVTITLSDDPVDYSAVRRAIEPPESKSLRLVGYLVLE